jgi:hypothetical protein
VQSIGAANLPQKASVSLPIGLRVSRNAQSNIVNLTYIKQGTELVGDAKDQYTGLDRFGPPGYANTHSGAGCDGA